MKLIVGLGNPGVQYADTRHNVGFMAVDHIARTIGAEFDHEEGRSLTAHGKYRGRKYLLAKPLTFMNLSGQAVKALLKKYALGPDDLTVIHDDVDIELGRVKEKQKGGAAGHNGIASIMEAVGTGGFTRLRVGVGRPPRGQNTADYVLSPFEGHEEEEITGSIEDCFRKVMNS